MEWRLIAKWPLKAFGAVFVATIVLATTATIFPRLILALVIEGMMCIRIYSMRRRIVSRYFDSSFGAPHHYSRLGSSP